MALGIHLDDSKIDPNVSCSSCEAVCCRLTVVLEASDEVPEHLVAHGENGVDTMAHDKDGWCSALDRSRQCCSIYGQRPSVCRRFAMGGGYCRLEREIFARGGLTLRVA
ncbi:YkgJ family cysteine cluster protein [Dokdonella sp.]|uniref:YkgJ family cysteine cluster protein n=1 Tax=Dokdonella sp. TaxID=2291710 RepID=UPI002B6EA5AE|nr:YkgJ family cysteine cluster protein [Dokdonella sp.]HPN79457.1 YkgJ family cysteine cluster protein [Dokdonella sp.]